jgi:hypothetical protein
MFVNDVGEIVRGCGEIMGMAAELAADARRLSGVSMCRRRHAASPRGQCRGGGKAGTQQRTFAHGHNTVLVWPAGALVFT